MTTKDEIDEMKNAYLGNLVDTVRRAHSDMQLALEAIEQPFRLRELKHELVSARSSYFTLMFSSAGWHWPWKKVDYKAQFEQASANYEAAQKAYEEAEKSAFLGEHVAYDKALCEFIKAIEIIKACDPLLAIALLQELEGDDE